MSTRSMIAMDNGSVFYSMRVHFDGYLHGVGHTLLYYYTDIDVVEELMELGWVSSLETEIKYMPHNPSETPLTHNNLEELIAEFKASDAEYLYIFNGLGWEYMTREMKEPLLLVPSDVAWK
jgi:hypothetical protein